MPWSESGTRGSTSSGLRAPVSDIYGRQCHGVMKQCMRTSPVALSGVGLHARLACNIPQQRLTQLSMHAPHKA